MRNMLAITSKDYSMRQDEICKNSINIGKTLQSQKEGCSHQSERFGFTSNTFLKCCGNITVNIDQVRVYRPRQSDTISSDSPIETLYDEQEVSHGSNRSNQGQFKEHKKTSSSQERVQSIAGPSKLPDRRNDTTTSGSRMEVSGRDNQTRQTRTTTRRHNEQAEKQSGQIKPIQEDLAHTIYGAVYKKKTESMRTSTTSKSTAYLARHIPQKKPQYGSVEWRSSA
ncbi:hypothetical protein TNCV_856121 [Trichonephila clavipes]|nr:hypothetical protein TNCV_856121 [Trichonephila clavipes]